MNTKKILLTVSVLVVAVIGWIFFKKGGDIAVTPTLSVPVESTISPSLVVLPNLVIYSDTGYTPKNLTIKKGEMVTWKNESKLSMWTASAMHPTHKIYPGTDIVNCGTSAGSGQFDACETLANGESWSFKFDNVGTWNYHNHSNSSHFGTVVVE